VIIRYPASFDTGTYTGTGTVSTTNFSGYKTWTFTTSGNLNF
jgi:hypothetical protein